MIDAIHKYVVSLLAVVILLSIGLEKMPHKCYGAVIVNQVFECDFLGDCIITGHDGRSGLARYPVEGQQAFLDCAVDWEPTEKFVANLIK